MRVSLTWNKGYSYKRGTNPIENWYAGFHLGSTYGFMIQVDLKTEVVPRARGGEFFKGTVSIKGAHTIRICRRKNFKDLQEAQAFATDAFVSRLTEIINGLGLPRVTAYTTCDGDNPVIAGNQYLTSDRDAAYERAVDNHQKIVTVDLLAINSVVSQ